MQFVSWRGEAQALDEHAHTPFWRGQVPSCVQYTLTASTAISTPLPPTWSCVRADPPPIAAFMTVPAVVPLFTQYTLAASTAMPCGEGCPVASTTGAPPPVGTWLTVPAARSVQ
jgi:hypothetical protein